MNRSQAQKLRVGSRVRWADDGSLGTVVHKSDHFLQIEWDDKTSAVFSFEDSQIQLSHVEPLGIRVPV